MSLKNRNIIFKMKISKVTDYAALIQWMHKIAIASLFYDCFCLYFSVGFNLYMFIVSKDAKIRNFYNQVPHLTQDTKGKVTNSQLDTTNESHEVSPFPAGDHKAHINRRTQRNSKHKTEKKT